MKIWNAMPKYLANLELDSPKCCLRVVMRNGISTEVVRIMGVITKV
ncbi:MAG: hypothetical protein SWX82_10850 [Cyanobacteriota bacterium]|nr:hypothetical protein [Cyanobacteriota bacterium]